MKQTFQWKAIDPADAPEMTQVFRHGGGRRRSTDVDAQLDALRLGKVIAVTVPIGQSADTVRGKLHTRLLYRNQRIQTWMVGDVIYAKAAYDQPEGGDRRQEN
jgi:hypothetical protein